MKGKLPVLEWLFKQSTYGGEEHLFLNIGEWMDYIKDSSNFRNPLYIETFCGKRLKYNPIFSVVRSKEGLVRNICQDCMMQYEPRQKTEEEVQKLKEAKEASDALPF